MSAFSDAFVCKTCSFLNQEPTGSFYMAINLGFKDYKKDSMKRGQIKSIL